MGDEEAVITELRLGPPGDATGTKNRKRAFFETAGDENSSTESSGGRGVDEPAAKGRVVGWPPVCSYRQRNAGAAPPVRKTYVKVSMDGAPYLRKVELDACRGGYTDLTAAVERLFGIGEFTGNDSEGYIEIYEDKEGDWMLVGDVPWDMFIESCKRLRIMKRSEAKRFGLQLRRSPSSDERKM